MKEYIYNYVKEIDELLNSNKKIGEDVIKRHLIKIEFFQHERFIHLIVTLFYALLVIVFIAACMLSPIFLIIVLMLVVFLIFYIVHYFRLENKVQYLYVQYDMLNEKKNN